MIRIKLTRNEDGIITVELSIGHHILMRRQINLTDSEAVTLEVPDE